MQRRLSTAVLLMAVLAAGCGYIMPGTWVDDPGNWSRAFHVAKPADVTVVHSKYWRSPYRTSEFAYFFEIAPNATLKETLVSDNKLQQMTEEEAAKAKENVLGPTPAWFAPKAAVEYDIWVYEGEPKRNFMALIDRESGVLFLSDYRV